LLEFDCSLRRGDFELVAAFKVRSAGVTALFGPSGCGKSTTLALIAGERRPDRGQIVLDGEVLADTAARLDVPMERRGIGWVFQEGRLFPHLTVAANLDYAHRVARRAARGRSLARARVVDVLGLSALERRWPRDLSGGERQRVAIGRALLSSPRLLLLDEPLASLDLERRTEILRLLACVRDEFRVPIVYVTHALAELLFLADDVVLLDAGRVVDSGPLVELAGRTRVSALAGRPDAGTLIEATVERVESQGVVVSWDGVTLHVHGFPCRVGERVRLYIEAQDVIVAAERPRAISVRNVLEARVLGTSVRDEGTVHVELDIGGRCLLAAVTAAAAAELELEPERVVYALVKSIVIEAPAGLGRRA
jgi:molybdate transport system ATP-binding protein